MKIEDRQFLIIIGQPKAGTTSLFKWLASHPDVCPSTYKEARFFLDENYPLPRPLAYDGSNISDYMKLFPCEGKAVYLEASPDYLYNKTPIKVAELLPNSRVVVIKREPTQRLISAFRYFQQRGAIPASMSFEDYLLRQSNMVITESTPVHLRALDQCRLENYLTPYEQAYRDRCMVLDFEELKADPRVLTQKVCRFVGIDEKYFDDFVFGAENETREPRFPDLSRVFHRVRTHVAHLLLQSPGLRKVLRPVSTMVQRIIYKNGQRVRVAVTQEAKTQIAQYLESHK